MRIRSIKPEFWRSDDISALDWNTRLLFVGLWSYVDDNGVGFDKLPAITADLFAADLAADSTETLRRVSLGLDVLHERGLIMRYRVGGSAYLHIAAWEQHQLVKNPNKPRHPLPTSENVEPTETVGTFSGDSTETLPTGTEEQGNRGTGEQTPSSALRADVERLCARLADRIEANGSKRPTITKRWHDSARLMLDSDGRTEDQISSAIDWCQSDEFWRSNVLSMPKLREKYDQLRLAAQRTARASPNGVHPTDENVARLLGAPLRALPGGQS